MRLFIDIETVPQHWGASHDIHIFKKKFRQDTDKMTDEQVYDLYKEKAALFAEFGKVVCVSIGYTSGSEIKVKSFFGDDEHKILLDVSEALKTASSLVAHNGKEFDYPFLCRRMIAGKIKLPSILQIQGLKPWEIKLEDTLEMWKFGQFGYRVSLESLCELLGVPSPKAGMDGSRVANVFYNEKDYAKIASYCEGDVIATINVYRSMNYQTII